MLYLTKNSNMMYDEVAYTTPLQNYRKIHHKSSNKYYFELKHNLCHPYKHQLQFPEVWRKALYRSFYNVWSGLICEKLQKRSMQIEAPIAPKFIKLR